MVYLADAQFLEILNPKPQTLKSKVYLADAQNRVLVNWVHVLGEAWRSGFRV